MNDHFVGEERLHTCTCAYGDQKLISGVIFNCSPILRSETKPGVHSPATMTGQANSRDLSLLHNAGTTGVHCSPQLFNAGAGEGQLGPNAGTTITWPAELCLHPHM